MMPTKHNPVNRLVVKIGSSLITNDGRGLDSQAVTHWVEQIAKIRSQGQEVLLVSSGAVAEGMQRLGWSKRPHEMIKLQAAAAVGQMGLVHEYEHCFAKHQIQTAQILLTHADLLNRERYLNARSTLLSLLKLNVVPIINENDTVVTDEIRFGDNDKLAALVANIVGASLLIILTDQQGLYTADPRFNSDATLISQAQANDPMLKSFASTSGSLLGQGGMLSKILAAQRAARSGASTIIASGHTPEILIKLLNGESMGTYLKADQTSQSNPRWITDQTHIAGEIVLNEESKKQIEMDGNSVLPTGLLSVSGEFTRGALINCVDTQGKVFAYGLTNYNSAQMRSIQFGKDNQNSATMSDAAISLTNLEKELIHRDNLVLI